MDRSAPVFGKRGRPVADRAAASPCAPSPLAPLPAEHAAFFAAIRAEAPNDDTPTRVVPRSYRAALLAGLIVGACLAGLDADAAGHADPLLQPLLQAYGLAESRETLPYVITMSLIGGARIAGTTLLIAHGLLARAGRTSHAAYALGGGAMAVAYAGLIQAITQAPPPHGWPIAIAAGAGAGFFYRMFAGVRVARG